MRKYLITSYFIIAISCYSCTHGSRASRNSFSNSPTETSTIAKITTHYNKDSILILILDYLPKLHFEIASVHNGIITVKQRDRLFYKYQLKITDGQILVSGKTQTVATVDTKPFSSESFWNTIYYGQGGITNARAQDDVKIIAGWINDAVLSYDK